MEKELKHLQEHLDSGETVEASVYGAYQPDYQNSNFAYNGILVATNRRVVLYAKYWGGYNLESFPYENISSFHYGKGGKNQMITIHASGNSCRLARIRADATQLVELIRSRIGKGSNVTPAAPVDDPHEKLRKLAELRDQGVISQEDFEMKKAALLEGM